MSRHIDSEKGVIIPLTALIISGLLVMLLILGVDTVLTRKAAVDLRRFTNELCRSTAIASITPTEAAYEFSQKLNEITVIKMDNKSIASGMLPNLEITEAHLIIPTFIPSVDSGDSSDVVVPDTFNNLGIESCKGVGSGDCIFHGNVTIGGDDPLQGSYLDPFLNGRFPTNYKFWSGESDQSTAIGCEIHAKVKGLFALNKWFEGDDGSSLSSFTNLEARSVMNKTLRSIGGIQVSGLTIAVAPEMTTEARDPRFRFSSAAMSLGLTPDNPLSVYGYSEDFLEEHDPLRWYNYEAQGADIGTLMVPSPYSQHATVPAFIKQPTYQTFTKHGVPFCNPSLGSNCTWNLYRTDSASSTHSFVIPASGAGPNSTSIPVPSPRSVVTSEGTPSSTFFIQDYPKANPTSSGLVVSQREERLAACLNPAILVRNQFLATTIQLASRTGPLRNSTELLMIPPYHRDVDDPEKLPTSANIPVQFRSYAAFGSTDELRPDLTKREYQLPFVSYRSPRADLNTPGYEPTFDVRTEGQGLVWPISLSDTTSVSESLLQHNALLAEQLRECYILYRDNYSISHPTLGTIKLRGMHLPTLSPFIGNLGFTGAEDYVWPTAGLADVRPETLLNLQTKSYPWITANYTQPPPSLTPSEGWASGNRFLTGAEVVSMVGSIQRAPSMSAYSLTGQNKYYVATKPTIPLPGDPNVLSKAATTELRPDLVSFLNVLGRENQNSLGFVRTSPGLSMPDNFSSYVATTETINKTHVLLVTHSRLSFSEVQAIQAAFQAPENVGLRHRRFTILYFPTNVIDASVEAVKRMREAFMTDSNITTMNGEDSEAAEDRFRQLIVLSPYAKNNYNSPNNSFVATNAWTPYIDSQDFANYWAYLLSPNNPTDNISTTAHRFMKEQVFANGVKF